MYLAEALVDEIRRGPQPRSAVSSPGWREPDVVTHGDGRLVISSTVGGPPL